jgi:hypothetical protein
MSAGPKPHRTPPITPTEEDPFPYGMEALAGTEEALARSEAARAEVEARARQLEQEIRRLRGES